VYVRILGPLSSKEVSGERGSRGFYVSFEDVLTADEVLTGTPVVVSSNASVEISGEAINDEVIVDGSRSIPIGKAVMFIATTIADLEEEITIDVHIESDSSYTDTATVRLAVVDTLE